MGKIYINNLYKNFEYNNFCLNINNLTLESGRIYYLYGENGSGKSVLLKILADIDKEYEGEIEHQKLKILYLNDKDVGFDYLTIKENIDLIYSFYKQEVNPNSYLLYNDSQLNTFYKDASLGMKTKVGLSLLYSNYFDLIILDETLSSLDDESRKKVYDRLMNYNNAIIIMTSHDELPDNLNTIKIYIEKGELKDER